MRHYEVVAVIHPDQQGRMSAMIDLYKKIVANGGGILHRFEDWGRRSLAYPIQSQHKAQYLLMNIECDGNTLDKLRETFRFSDSILRSMVMRQEKAITAPSPIMKAINNKESDKSGKQENAVQPATDKPEKSAPTNKPAPAEKGDES